MRGKAIWRAEKEKRRSFDLLVAALRGTGVKISADEIRGKLGKGPTIFLIEYRDGQRGTVVMVNGIGREFGVALKLQGKAKFFVNHYWLQDKKPYRHFEHLVRAIEPMIQTSKPSYPVERTLLTTGILDRIMHSAAEKGRLYQKAELAVGYQPSEWPFTNQEERFPLPE